MYTDAMYLPKRLVYNLLETTLWLSTESNDDKRPWEGDTNVVIGKKTYVMAPHPIYQSLASQVKIEKKHYT